ncbi:MAG: hypothetical protein JO347_04900 [Candidatus Eremiobacteraeota bacterium]|nr:hypothetical protein [Candidatus Eremiobacteraeota bacterium]MBV8281387.1 hypothetical protein [Candidatus Eremiobacteraeota bacterium]
MEWPWRLLISAFFFAASVAGVVIARYPREFQALYVYLLTRPFSGGKPPEREGVYSEWLMSDLAILGAKIGGFFMAVFFAIVALCFLFVKDL